MQVYSNTMKDAPQLTNEWGSITKILDFIFTDFAALDFTKIEAYDTGIAKITYDQATNPLVLGQTIVVTGTTSYNKKFLVTNFNTDGTALIENRSVVKGTPSETGAFKMKLEACPIKKLHGGTADQRIVVQFKNGWVGRFDDRDIGPLLTPTVTWNDTSAKFARVAIAEGSTGKDNLTGKQIPYNDAMPTLNIAPVNDYVGIAILPYNISNFNLTNLSTINQATPATFNRPLWFVVVDENFLWINTIVETNVTPGSANTSSRNVMISDYDSFHSYNGKGMSLYAYTTTSQTDTKYNVSTWQCNSDSANVIFKSPGAGVQNTFMWDDSYTSVYVSFSIFPMLNMGSSASSIMSGSSTAASVTLPYINNTHIICETLMTNGANNIRGINRYLHWVCTTWNDPYLGKGYGKIFNMHSDRYFIVQQYYSTPDPNNGNTAKGLIKLKVPT